VMVLVSAVELPEDALDRLAYVMATLSMYVTSVKWIAKR
jgi:hypothetical protein